MKRSIRAMVLLFLVWPVRHAMPETTGEGLDFKPGPEWQVAHHAEDGGNTITEFVLAGDDIHSWKQLVTIQKFVGSEKSSPKQELDALKKLRERECPGATDWNVIEKDESSILYEWHAKPCQGWPEQNEIARIIFGKHVRYFLRYTVKAPALAPETRTQWIQAFSSAAIDADATLNAPDASGPANAPSEPAASSPAPPISVQDMARELSAKWGLNSAGDAQLRLKEAGRRTVRGHTEITYGFESAHFPQGFSYTLWHMQSGDQKVAPFMGGFVADSTGELICPATPQPGSFIREGAPCIPARTLEQSVSLDLSGYHEGEPADFALVSTDGAVRAFARAYPFPIQAQDGKCTLIAEFEDTKMTSWIIRGTGFEPGEVVKTSSSFGGDATAGTQAASPQGEFAAALRADVQGKNSGSGTFAATGGSCHPVVTFGWGKAAMKVQ
jgi:hypothetical protein